MKSLTFTSISLWQPWASLWSLGEKVSETRHWATGYRGILLVHAAKRMTPETRRLSLTEPFRETLKKDPSWMAKRGHVIGAVYLSGCYKINADLRAKQTAREIAFGDWTDGRYAWSTTHRVVFPEPFFFKGYRRFFEAPERNVLLATELWGEAPDWWHVADQPCLCGLCRSYGD